MCLSTGGVSGTAMCFVNVESDVSCTLSVLTTLVDGLLKQKKIPNPKKNKADSVSLIFIGIHCMLQGVDLLSKHDIKPSPQLDYICNIRYY